MNYVYNTESKTYFSELKRYSNKEIIYISSSGETIYGGVIKKGVVFLETLDQEGSRRILDVYNTGDLILPESIPTLFSDNISLVARSSCEIYMFRKSESDKPTDAKSEYISLSQEASKSMNRVLSHVYIMSQSTTRKKLLSFLKYYSNGKQKFTLPLSLSDCSDYLSVDRSAMMREIKRLEDDGLISHKNKEFELFY